MPNKAKDNAQNGNQNGQGGAKGENVQSSTGSNQKDKQSTDNSKKG